MAESLSKSLTRQAVLKDTSLRAVTGLAIWLMLDLPYKRNCIVPPVLFSTRTVFVVFET